MYAYIFKGGSAGLGAFADFEPWKQTWQYQSSGKVTLKYDTTYKFKDYKHKIQYWILML